jgi:ribosome-binding protein aMBF1 (putative translation factor)
MRPQYSARLRRIPTKIPNAIRQYRLKAGLTQAQLAKRLKVRAECQLSPEGCQRFSRHRLPAKLIAAMQ